MTARERTTRQAPSTRTQSVIDSSGHVARLPGNGRPDVLGRNDLARALYHRDEDPDAKPQNFARYLFLDPTSIDELADWRGMSEDVVAILRQEAGRDPHSTELSDFTGELSTRSSDFRTMWASHRVRFHRTGTKQFHHPDVGDLELSFEALQLPGDDGLTLIAYSAQPGSRSHDALALLASLRATARQQESPAAARTQDRD